MKKLTIMRFVACLYFVSAVFTGAVWSGESAEKTVSLKPAPDQTAGKAAALKKALERETDESARAGILDALASMKDPAAIPFLIKQLENSERGESNRSLMKLRSFGVAAVPAMIELYRRLTIPALPLKSDGREAFREAYSEYKRVLGIKRGVIKFFGKVRGVAAEEILLKALVSDEWKLRSAAIYSLGKLRSRKAAPALVKVLIGENDDYVRSQAASALGDIGDAGLVPDLIDRLDSEEHGRIALDLLRCSTGEDFGRDKAKWLAWLKNQKSTSVLGADRTVLKALQKALKDSSDKVREEAIRSLDRVLGRKPAKNGDTKSAK